MLYTVLTILEIAAIETDAASAVRRSLQTPCTWNPIGTDLTGTRQDRLGQAVLISGDGSTIAVGGQGLLRGAIGFVELFSLENGNRVQLGNAILEEFLPGSDAIPLALDLSHDGRAIAVGRLFARVNGLPVGTVRVHRYSSSQKDWLQLGPTLNGQRRFEEFGSSVAVSGNGTIVAIGVTGRGFGEVNVFDLVQNNETTWRQLGNDIILTGASEFGTSVSLSNNGMILAVGDRKSDAGGNMRGTVSVWQYDTATSWTVLGDTIVGEDFEGLGFRVELAADGRTVAIAGGPHDSTVIGKVRVYTLSSNQQWQQLGNTILGVGASASSNDFLSAAGVSISLSPDGRSLAVGSPGDSESGTAQAYRYEASVDEWLLVGGKRVGVAPGDQYGGAVAISVQAAQASLIVGGRMNTEDGESAGHAQAFSIDPVCFLDQVDFERKESRVSDNVVVFSGIEGELDSLAINKFETVSSEWFDDYFDENIPRVKSMSSRFAVNGQNIALADGSTNVMIRYSQRISYVEALGSNFSDTELVVLPFLDPEALNDYGMQLTTNIEALENLQIPIGVPVIRPQTAPPVPNPIVNETNRISAGTLAGIIAGVVVLALVVASFLFRRYRRAIPIAEKGVIENPADDAIGAYRVDDVVLVEAEEAKACDEERRLDHEAAFPLESPAIPEDESTRQNAATLPHIVARRADIAGGPEFKDQVRNSQRHPAPVNRGSRGNEDGYLQTEPNRRSSALPDHVARAAEETGGPSFKDQARYNQRHRASEYLGARHYDEVSQRASDARNHGVGLVGRSLPDRGPDFKDQARYSPRDRRKSSTGRERDQVDNRRQSRRRDPDREKKRVKGAHASVVGAFAAFNEDSSDDIHQNLSTSRAHTGTEERSASRREQASLETPIPDQAHLNEAPLRDVPTTSITVSPDPASTSERREPATGRYRRSAGNTRKPDP